MNLFVYTLEVTASSAILFAYYRFFLKNRQHHQFNRIFLLLVALSSPLIPFLSIPVLPGSSQSGLAGIDEAALLSGGEHGQLPHVDQSHAWPEILTNTLLIVYVAVTVSLLILLIRSLIKIIKLKRKYPLSKTAGVNFYNTVEPDTPYSFMKNLFWNQDVDLNTVTGQQMFRHEFYHIRQHHSVDILLMEFLNATLWVNPIFHFIKSELKAIHEFMADDFAALNADPLKYAELLVYSAKEKTSPSAAHPFASFHIKRRIAMITKANLKKTSVTAQLLTLPLFLLIASGFGLDQKPVSDSTKKSEPTVVRTRPKENKNWNFSTEPVEKEAGSNNITKRKITSGFTTIQQLPQDSIKPKKSGRPDDLQKTYAKTQIEASYPGGFTAWRDYLIKNLKYPEKAVADKVQGTVIIQFIVNTDGKLESIESVSGPEALRAEGERILKESGNWNPAINDGKKVRSYKKQPVVFRLES